MWPKTCHAAVSKAYFAGPGSLQQCSPWQRAEAAAKLGSENSTLQRCSAGKALSLTGEATVNVHTYGDPRRRPA